MKTWTRFLLIPFITLIVISMTLNFADIQFAKDSMIAILLITFQCLAFVTVPYLMLVFAPKRPYVSTLCYMAVLLGFMFTLRITFSNVAFYQQGIYLSLCALFWTTSAISIHFFYNEQDLKIKSSSRS